jgi:hypothetical protein
MRSPADEPRTQEESETFNSTSKKQALLEDLESIDHSVLAAEGDWVSPAMCGPQHLPGNLHQATIFTVLAFPISP